MDIEREGYKTAEYLSDIRLCAPVFLAESLGDGLKPKREEQIKKVCLDIYDSHMSLFSLAGNIQMSHLLGCNEVVAPVLVEEYALLALQCVKIETELKKLNQFPEIKGSVDRLKTLLSKDNLYRALNDDLNHLDQEFDLKLNVAELMISYKSTVKKQKE
jgi:hypothetical protein